MRTLLLSFLVSMATIILVSIPAIQTAPLEMIPRVSLYLATPLTMVVSVFFLGVTHLIQVNQKSTELRATTPRTEQQSMRVNENKAA